MIKRMLFGMLAAVTLLTAMTGCSTVPRGAGEDVEQTTTPIFPSNVPPP